MPNPQSPLVLFDGLCPLCHFWVRFLLKRDSAARFLFAPLHGAAAKAALRDVDAAALPDSVGLVAGGTVAFKSAAVLGMLRILDGPWAWIAQGLGVIPKAWLDRLYDQMARHRKRLFGAYSACPVAPARFQGRFLP